MQIVYPTLPTPAKFKSDSSVLLANRSSDRNLVEIDQLLEQYFRINERTADLTRIRQAAMLGMLWFACDHWLKIVDGGKKFVESASMNAKRRPVIYELYKCIATTLSFRTGVPINRLPDWLTITFGAQMLEHGAETDNRGNANYLDSETLMRYRLHFKGGRAYQEKWWDNSRQLVLADSANSIMATSADKGANKEGLSGYAASLGRDFYMAYHFVPSDSSKSFYHSSYLSGRPVMCSGTILIKNGEVKMITNDSGHYQPGVGGLAQAVEALGALGVPLDKLDVRPYGDSTVKGDAFLFGFCFNIRGMQVENLLRELDRNQYHNKRVAAGRLTDENNRKQIQELVKHLKEAHGSNYQKAVDARLKCATCKAHWKDGQKDETMTVALWVITPEAKRKEIMEEGKKKTDEENKKKLTNLPNTRPKVS
ncbi:MAG TPA: hypothetical protein VNV43_02780 [Candidatus Acidoferrales bacterium]|jgi:hypothetical protein|nr:hypothetical protein [Candidatus Acidoferrales bacterium]